VLLPMRHCEFALTVATAGAGGSEELAEENIENAEALFEVWLAVEMAEVADQGLDLLDALPGLSGASDAGAAPDMGAGEACPEFLPPELVPMGPRGREVEVFLRREAAWLLGPAVDLELELEDLPRLVANPIEFETCLRELLTSAAVGLSRRVTRVSVSVVPADPAAPGALITIEDDAGQLSPMTGVEGTRHSRSLFLAAEAIAAAGGSLRLAAGTHGGMRVAVWLPAD